MKDINDAALLDSIFASSRSMWLSISPVKSVV